MEGITLTVRPLSDLYNLTVIAPCSGAVILTLKLVHSSGEAWRRRMTRSAHWVGSGALFERGIAGLVVDGVSDLVWWPTSLVGRRSVRSCRGADPTSRAGIRRTVIVREVLYGA